MDATSADGALLQFSAVVVTNPGVAKGENICGEGEVNIKNRRFYSSLHIENITLTIKGRVKMDSN